MGKIVFVLLFLLFMVVPITQTLGVEKKTVLVSVTGKEVPVFPLTNVHVAENQLFKETEVSGQQGKYQVKGFANPAEGYVYYTIEDGHNELIQETKVEMDHFGWQRFTIEIEIPERKLPKNGTVILNLYVRGEDYANTNSYPVVLEKFNP